MRKVVTLKIIRHEWCSLTADATAWIVLVVFGVTIGYALFNGATRVRQQRATSAELTRLEHERISTKRRQNAETWQQIATGQRPPEIPDISNDPKITPLYASSASYESQTGAVFPLSQLASLSLGQIDLYPAAYQPSPEGFIIETFASAQQAENPFRLLVGNFDLAFVVLYLLPLFVLALSYNLVAYEKETGVLGLLLSQPIGLRKILLAKVIIRAALIFGATTLFIFLGSLAAGIDWSETTVVTKFVLWWLVVLLYGAFWFSLAFFVNAFGKSSSTNAVILAACWLTLLLLIPAACAFAAKNFFPIPSHGKLMDAKRNALAEIGSFNGKLVKDLDDENSRSSIIAARFLAENPDLHVADAPSYKYIPEHDKRWANYVNTNPKWRSRVAEQKYQLVVAARTAEIERMTKPLQDEFDRQHRGQHGLFDRLQMLSPATLTQSTLSSISGTHATQHDRFLEQVLKNHREWRKFFLKISLNGELLKESDYSTFPHFRYQEEPLESVIARIKWPLIMLTLLAVVFATAGSLAFRRYPII